jgi:hypothetical protein
LTPVPLVAVVPLASWMVVVGTVTDGDSVVTLGPSLA